MERFTRVFHFAWSKIKFKFDNVVQFVNCFWSGRYEFHMPSSLCLQNMPCDLLGSDPKAPLQSVSSVGFEHKKAKPRTFMSKTDGFGAKKKVVGEVSAATDTHTNTVPNQLVGM